MEWLRKLSDAIAYIEQNLDAEISYEEAARIACCSPYYFQRMFSYVAGISLSDYIRRRRMSQAAFDLQRCDARVLDVALKYGYTSPTAFNRAFQKVHGIPPTAAKNIGKTLHAYPPIQFSVNITGGSPMAYHIAEKRELRFAGIRRWRRIIKLSPISGRKQCKVRNTQSSVSYPIPVRMQSSASAYMRIPITFSTI